MNAITDQVLSLVQGEIRAMLQEMVRAAEMRVQHDTDRVQDEASNAVRECADAALKEREAVWVSVSARTDSPKVTPQPASGLREVLEKMVGTAQDLAQRSVSGSAAEIAADLVAEIFSKVVNDLGREGGVSDATPWGMASAQTVPGTCLCKPWTTVNGRGVYLQPGDNLGKVRGWDRTAGCPVHPIEGRATCGAPSLSGNLTCTLDVHDVDQRHSGGGASWPNVDGQTGASAPAHQVLFGVPVQVNVKAFTELAGERPTRENVRELVAEALKNSLVVDVIRLRGGA